MHFYLMCIFIILFKCENINAFCPIKCNCDDNQLIADCTNGSLDLVPITLNPQIKQLKLAFNQIKSIKETFSFYSSLQLLDLSYNHLVTLGTRNFVGLHNLHVLNIRKNRISILSNQTFQGPFNLIELDISYNEFRIIRNRAFTGLNKLQSIDLSFNALNTIESEAFTGLVNLKVLNLEHNHFTHVPSTSFYHLLSLRNLILNHNPIQNIGEYSFSSLQNLKLLSLNHCELTQLSRNCFHDLKQLKYLNLNFNKFQYVPIESLNSLVDLEYFEFKGTFLDELHSNSFLNLKKLKHISLGYDQHLHRLSLDLFQSNLNLISIEIRHCKNLAKLPNKLFSHLNRLVLLNLDNNNLNELPLGIFNSSRLQHLNLVNNPLKCDCNLAWLYSLYSTKFNNLLSKQNLQKKGYTEEDINFLLLHNLNLTSSLSTSIIQPQNQYKSNSKLNNIEKIDYQFKYNKWPNVHELNTVEYGQFSNSQQQDVYKPISPIFSSNHISFSNLDYQGKTKNNDKFIPENTNNIINVGDTLYSESSKKLYHSSADQNYNYNIATCKEPSYLNGQLLSSLSAVQLKCDSILENVENTKTTLNNNHPLNTYLDKDNVDKLTNAVWLQTNTNNNHLTDATSTETNSNNTTIWILAIFSVCIASFLIVSSVFFFCKHRLKNQNKHNETISTWILNRDSHPEQGFQSLSSSPHNLNSNLVQDDHLKKKCNTLVNPLAKLGPLPEKPIFKSTYQSINEIKPSSLKKKCSNAYSRTSNNAINNKNCQTNLNTQSYNNSNQLYEKINLNYNQKQNFNNQYDHLNYIEQIYEDPIQKDFVHSLNNITTNGNSLNNFGTYSYQQLNSATSTSSSSYASGTGPTTYEEFVATANMRAPMNGSSYNTLNSRLSNPSNYNNNKRILNIAHL